MNIELSSSYQDINKIEPNSLQNKTVSNKSNLAQYNRQICIISSNEKQINDIKVVVVDVVFRFFNMFLFKPGIYLVHSRYFLEDTLSR